MYLHLHTYESRYALCSDVHECAASSSRTVIKVCIYFDSNAKSSIVSCMRQLPVWYCWPGLYFPVNITSKFFLVGFKTAELHSSGSQISGYNL